MRRLYRPDGWPRHNAINKWTEKITVGVDFPTYNSLNKEKYLGGITELYPLIEEQARNLLPEISRLTGLPVEFIGPDDPREQTEEYARIRIDGTIFP